MGQELRVGSAESANGYSMNLQREGAVEFSSQTEPHLKPGHFVISHTRQHRCPVITSVNDPLHDNTVEKKSTSLSLARLNGAQPWRAKGIPTHCIWRKA